MVLPKGISMESLTTVVGITVQKPTRSTAAVTKTDGTQAFAVDKEGQAELRMANRVTGVRPALTLPSDQVIVEEDGHLRPKEE